MTQRSKVTLIIIILILLVGGSTLFYFYKKGRLGLFADIIRQTKSININSESEWNKDAILNNTNVTGGMLQLKEAEK